MKKLIVRADDFGYTVAHNDGTMEAIDNGIVTSVDLMLDTPGTLDAMERIRAYPWICRGQPGYGRRRSHHTRYCRLHRTVKAFKSFQHIPLFWIK